MNSGTLSVYNQKLDPTLRIHQRLKTLTDYYESDPRIFPFQVEATVKLHPGIAFHATSDTIGAVSRRMRTPQECNARLVKFEIHVKSDQGKQLDKEGTCHRLKYEFKCTSVDVRDLWKAYILAIAQGISPTESRVHLLPGQVMQIERMMELEQKRCSQRSQRSALPSTPRIQSSEVSSTTSTPTDGTDKTPVQKSKSLHVPANSARHKFYKDGAKITPSYYFEHISREMAEHILRTCQIYGNLLMRRSTSYPNSYALSFRSTLNRDTEFLHYEVGPFKKQNSLDTYFEIKMEGKHPKFRCLNDVVKYFIKLTDGMATCVTTNDLEKLGIKQPPYATHYEPPVDYEEHPGNAKALLPLPPIPNIHSAHQEFDNDNFTNNTGSDDPNSESITSLEDDFDEQQKLPSTSAMTARAPSSPNTKSGSPKQPLKLHISSSVDPSAAFHRRNSAVHFRLAAVESNPIHKPGMSVTFSPPPAPPPPRPDGGSGKLVNVPSKSALKAPPPQMDRRQFVAPEKNLFRIALEYEEKEKMEELGPDLIKEPTDLARQLKGNVKSRVADLEVEGERPSPNFSRPVKKDFMGELAEKLKIRRQVVEQTCW